MFIQLLSLLDYGAKERTTDAKILRYIQCRHILTIKLTVKCIRIAALHQLIQDSDVVLGNC